MQFGLAGLLGYLIVSIFTAKTQAQQSDIVPDKTLGAESSQVIGNYQGQPKEVITGGAIRQINLFHSFGEFNISEGRMVLEPIWESDFFNCSNGFRPGRRTQDCIALLDSYINKRNKYFWVIEGDIKGAFDNIHHEILLKLVAKRVTDKRLLKLMGRFLKVGMMQGTSMEFVNKIILYLNIIFSDRTFLGRSHKIALLASEIILKECCVIYPLQSSCFILFPIRGFSFLLRCKIGMLPTKVQSL